MVLYVDGRQAFAELRYGVVVKYDMRENSVNYNGHNVGQTLYIALANTVPRAPEYFTRGNTLRKASKTYLLASTSHLTYEVPPAACSVCGADRCLSSKERQPKPPRSPCVHPPPTPHPHTTRNANPPGGAAGGRLPYLPRGDSRPTSHRQGCSGRGGGPWGVGPYGTAPQQRTRPEGEIRTTTCRVRVYHPPPCLAPLSRYSVGEDLVERGARVHRGGDLGRCGFRV